MPSPTLALKFVDWRHSYAVTLRRRGVSDVIIARQLSHSTTVLVATRYGRFTPDKDDMAYAFDVPFAQNFAQVSETVREGNGPKLLSEKMPGAGLEPARGFPQGILSRSPARQAINARAIHGHTGALGCTEVQAGCPVFCPVRLAIIRASTMARSH
ncbi:MAG: hypothetical protein ACLPKW_10070 [Acetobacteraceae bacterium]